MDFAGRDADPQSHMLGLSIVVLLHVTAIYALMTGLANRVADVVRRPIETRLIEAEKSLELPREVAIAPPSRLETPQVPLFAPPKIRIEMRQGIEQGEALIQFTMTAGGEVKDAKDLHASNPIFDCSSIRIVLQYRCRGQGRDLLVTAAI